MKTPDLLRLWGYAHQASCALCDASNCTLHHILSNCSVALKQKRYTWRHDSVLMCIRNAVRVHIETLPRQEPPSRDKMIFIRAGDPVPKATSKRKRKSILSGSTDWLTEADFDHKRFPFPASICGTNQRPDLVIWSPSRKVVILAELTCPAEEGIQNATHRKKKRYEDLLCLIREQGWTPHLFTIEVGARGFVAKSTLQFLYALGLSHNSSSVIAKKLSSISARCSYAIYVVHSSLHWDSKRPLLEPVEKKDHVSPELKESLAKTVKDEQSELSVSVKQQIEHNRKNALARRERRAQQNSAVSVKSPPLRTLSTSSNEAALPTNFTDELQIVPDERSDQDSDSSYGLSFYDSGPDPLTYRARIHMLPASDNDGDGLNWVPSVDEWITPADYASPPGDW